MIFTLASAAAAFGSEAHADAKPGAHAPRATWRSPEVFGVVSLRAVHCWPMPSGIGTPAAGANGTATMDALQRIRTTPQVRSRHTAGRAGPTHLSSVSRDSPRSWGVGPYCSRVIGSVGNETRP
jgi:hypothetical protein